MPGALDAKMQDLAKNLIPKFGKSLLYADQTGFTYNPATGEVSGGTESNKAFVGLVANIQDDQIDGETFMRGDLIVLMAAKDLGFTPEVNRVIYLGSTTGAEQWRIVSIKPTYSGEQVATYDVQVRK